MELEMKNNAIRRVSLIDGRTDTLCGRGKEGKRNEVTFYNPNGLAFDSISKHLYVADYFNHAIRRVSVKDGKVETLCGRNDEGGYHDGSFEESEFHCPSDVALNSSTEELYVTDCGNEVIRVISLKNRRVRTLCGTSQEEGYKDGLHNQAKFYYPLGIALDTCSNYLYVTDWNHVVRRVSLSGEVRVSILCGSPNLKGMRDGLTPKFNNPKGIVVDHHSSSLYVMDFGNDRVRKVIDRTKEQKL